MKEDILIKARIVSKEWQITQCEDIIRDTSESVSEKLSEIRFHLTDDSDSLKLAHHSLYTLLKKIDNQETLRLGLKQQLQKLNNKSDGYCYCEKCVANRARGNNLARIQTE